ncbi:MAG: hypothetical protein EP329_16410 [Deltaproteobacteria bacterium]|nr:MAG: hypothetical protein EP329_16410 [Deltaproteobacteria bacterium]
MIVRRCLERRFMLQPSPLVNLVFEYLLAVGCQRFGIEPVALVVMSDHYHLVANDVYGRHPKLTEWLHAQVAKVVNEIRGRTDAFWESRAPVVTELVDAGAVLEMCAYTLANPTQAGLVEHGWQWIGIRSAPDAVLGGLRVARPDLPYFRRDKWPEVVELQFRKPMTHRHLSDEAWAAVLTERTEALEAGARRAFKAAGRTFLGVERLRRRRWTDRAQSAEGHGRGQVLKPEVAARDAEARRGVLDRIASFRAQYRRALEAFVAGVRGVLFPEGTYQMVERYAVACHPPP